MRNKTDENLIQTRQYGTKGPKVMLLHGGPGAAGYMAPVAKVLAEHFPVIEPLQRRGDCDNSLTVARHVTDLNDIIKHYCPGEKPILAGHSWGAMLSLIYAAQFPDAAASLVLIGCGTFNEASRAHMRTLRHERMADHKFQRMKQRMEQLEDPDERLQLMGKIMIQIDSFDLKEVPDEVVYYDGLGHEQTWHDMMELMKNGVYPAAFKTIRVPVLMLHGSYDPHPGEMIRDSLTPYIPQIEFHQWQQCGHYPWLEKAVCEDFYSSLARWLLQTGGGG